MLKVCQHSIICSKQEFYLDQYLQHVSQDLSEFTTDFCRFHRMKF